jgi:hypothetical protein
MNTPLKQEIPLRFVLVVCRRDIKGAKRLCAVHCPIARSTRRRFPGRRIEVHCSGRTTIYSRGGRLAFAFRPSFADAARVKDWIDRFDTGKRMRPIRFSLVSDGAKTADQVEA